MIEAPLIECLYSACVCVCRCRCRGRIIISYHHEPLRADYLFLIIYWSKLSGVDVRTSFAVFMFACNVSMYLFGCVCEQQQQHNHHPHRRQHCELISSETFLCGFNFPENSSREGIKCNDMLHYYISMPILLNHRLVSWAPVSECLVLLSFLYNYHETETNSNKPPNWNLDYTQRFFSSLPSFRHFFRVLFVAFQISTDASRYHVQWTYQFRKSIYQNRKIEAE